MSLPYAYHTGKHCASATLLILPVGGGINRFGANLPPPPNSPHPFLHNCGGLSLRLTEFLDTYLRRTVRRMDQMDKQTV